jgi:hypothetical protein
MHNVCKGKPDPEHISGLTDTQLRSKIQDIVGCYGDMCWPCPHGGIVDRVMELIKAIREGR